MEEVSTSDDEELLPKLVANLVLPLANHAVQVIQDIVSSYNLSHMPAICTCCTRFDWVNLYQRLSALKCALTPRLGFHKTSKRMKF